MPTRPVHGWPRATLATFLFAFVLTLPSCMTGLLWGARTSGSSRAGIATTGVLATGSDAGTTGLAVRLGDDMPSELGTRVGPAFTGQWLQIDLDAADPALAEVLRLRRAGAADGGSCQLWLHRDGTVRVEASATVPAAQLAAIRVVPRLGIRREADAPLTVRATCGGVLRDPTHAPSARTPDGEVVADAALNWWRPAADAPRHGLAARLALTPITVVMDAALGPVVLLAGAYALTYEALGGRG
jgi:hypothetical protein